MFIADRGISRHISDGTFSNGHCGTVTELNVICIRRLIMKRKERKSAQSERCIHAANSKRKDHVPLPRASAVATLSHSSLIDYTRASSGLLCDSRRWQGKRGTAAASRPFYCESISLDYPRKQGTRNGFRHTPDDPRPETSIAEEQSASQAHGAAGATAGHDPWHVLISAPRAPFQGPNFRPLSASIGPKENPRHMGGISTSLCVHQLPS